MNIQFYMPTRVVMGKDCIKNNAALLASLGKKALIVTGAHSAKANGSLGDVTAALTSQGREYIIFDKVMANPTVACVYEGAEMAKAQKVDFVIAIGGGSPMDAAKAIALLACQDIAEEKLFLGNFGEDVLPMAFVPTTSGTGSEVTPYAVLTNDIAQTKTSISLPQLFPKISFLDAKYTVELPVATTVNTAIDALSHSVEGMLTVRANAVTDTLAVDSIGCIVQCFAALKKGVLTFEDREKLLYASMLGGMVIAQTGTTAVHSMGYALTYFDHIDHGRANGLLLAAFLKFVQKSKPQLVTGILAAMGFTTVDEFKNALAALLGETEHFTANVLDNYTASSSKAKNLANCVAVPTSSDISDIYRESFGL